MLYDIYSCVKSETPVSFTTTAKCRGKFWAATIHIRKSASSTAPLCRLEVSRIPKIRSCDWQFLQQSCICSPGFGDLDSADEKKPASSCHTPLVLRRRGNLTSKLSTIHSVLQLRRGFELLMPTSALRRTGRN